MGEKSPDMAAGDDTYRTISVRGTGFAPHKQIHMVLPPDVRTFDQLEEFLSTSDAKDVHEIALEGLKHRADG